MYAALRRLSVIDRNATRQRVWDLNWMTYSGEQETSLALASSAKRSDRENLSMQSLKAVSLQSSPFRYSVSFSNEPLD